MTKNKNTAGAPAGSAIEFGSIPDADKQFVVDALNKGANRRQVMGWLMAMGATVGAAGSIVTAATEAIAATPKKGGNVRFAWDLHGPSDTMDPTLFTSSLDYGRGRLNYNNLTRFQDDLTVKPELATSWEANKDATEWTFKLRKGVEWHDGSKFTADDVVFAMMRHIGKDSKSKAKVLVGSVKEWKKVDDHTVKATLDAPNAELPIILATFHFKIVKNGETNFQNPQGTGPYKTKEFKPGVRSVHTRNDGYWNDEAGPYVDQFEAFGITDKVARINALISGDIQMSANLDPKSIPQIEAAAGVEPFSVPSGRYPTISVMLDKAPGNSPEFATGLKYLQRRERILKSVQKGQGTVGNDQPVGSAYGADWCDKNAIRAYDPDKAKHHLKKSGVTTAELHVAEVYPGMTDICNMLQRECQKVGFNLQLKKVPNDGYWGAVWLKKPMSVSSWNMRPSANIMMTLAYKGGAPWNETAWKDERFDKLLAEARGELDLAKKAEMNCELQKICSNGSGSLIPTHSSYLDAVSSKLKGFPKVPLAAFGGMEWPEFIWLDT
ncbi:MAG: ABC transporter substrate-binding protein [Hyphomicrobiaceae bacterium]